MPTSSKSQGGTKDQYTKSVSQKRLGTKSEDFTFLTTEAKSNSIVYKDPPREEAPLHITPIAGKDRASINDATHGENKSLILAMWFQDIPLSDPLASMKPLYRKLKATIRTWDSKNPQYEWWADYPDAVSAVCTASELAAADFMSTAWLMKNRYKLAKRVIHKIFDYSQMRLYYEASVYNIAQFISYNGNEYVTRIASIFRQASLNKFVKNFKAFGVVPRGCDAYYLDYTRMAFGTNNRDEPILAFPLWRTWFTGNDWYHSIAYEEVEKLDNDGKTAVSQPGVWLTAHLNASKHLFNVLSEYVYRDEESETNYKSHFNGIKPHCPDIANLGRLYAQGGAMISTTSQPGIKVASACTASDGWTKPVKTDFEAGKETVESNLMSTLINNWKFFQMYLAAVHPEFTQNGHDILKIADMFDLFEQPKDLPAMTKLLGRNDNYDLNDLISKMSFDPNAPMDTTIINYAPFRMNRYTTDIDFKCDTTDVSTQKMNVFASNFERYELDDESQRAEKSIAAASEWPHLNPSIFVDNTGELHTSNALPALGSRLNKDLPIARSGSIKSIMDVAQSQYFVAEDSDASVYLTDEAHVKTMLSQSPNVVYDEYPFTSWRMHLPLFSKSDPARSGFNLMIVDDTININVWQQFFRNTSSYLSLSKQDTDKVDSILGSNPGGTSVIPSNLPSTPLWRSDLKHTIAGIYEGRKHVVNDKFVKGMGEAFVFVGLNILFNPYDIYASDRTGFLYASYDPASLSDADAEQLSKDWSSCVSSSYTDEERNLMSSGLLRAARPDDNQDADNSSFFAVLSVMSDFKATFALASKELKLFINSPDFGPVLWNVVNTRDDFLCDQKYLPILLKQEVSYEDMEGPTAKLRPNFHFARYDISADQGFTTGLNEDVLLDQLMSMYDNAKGWEVPTWMNKFFNDLLIKFSFVVSKPTSGLERIPETTDREENFFFGDVTCFEDISCGYLSVKNIGGGAKTIQSMSFLLPALSQESIATTKEIPANYVETPRFIPKLNATHEGKGNMGNIRNRRPAQIHSPDNSTSVSGGQTNSRESGGFTGSNGDGNTLVKSSNSEKTGGKGKGKGKGRRNQRIHTADDRMPSTENMEASGYDASTSRQDEVVKEDPSKKRFPTTDQPNPENS